MTITREQAYAIALKHFKRPVLWMDRRSGHCIVGVRPNGSRRLIPKGEGPTWHDALERAGCFDRSPDPSPHTRSMPITANRPARRESAA